MAGEPDDADTMVEPVVPSRHRWLAGLLGARPGYRLADLGCGTGGTLAQAATAAFDRVLCHNVLEVLPDHDALVAEAVRVLRPGGRLVLAHSDFDTLIFASEDLELTRRLVRAYCDTQQPWMDAVDGTIGRRLADIAGPYLYSGPSPVASLAGVLVGLQVNETRGDDLRAILWARTRRILDHLEKLGAFTLNRSGFPIVEVPLADADDLAKAGRFPLDQGIYVTLAFYPGVPREEVGFRIQVTAANTDDEVTELLAALDQLADVIPLRPI